MQLPINSTRKQSNSIAFCIANDFRWIFPFHDNNSYILKAKKLNIELQFVRIKYTNSERFSFVKSSRCIQYLVQLISIHHFRSPISKFCCCCIVRYCIFKITCDVVKSIGMCILRSFCDDQNFTNITFRNVAIV